MAWLARCLSSFENSASVVDLKGIAFLVDAVRFSGEVGVGGGVGVSNLLFFRVEAVLPAVTVLLRVAPLGLIGLTGLI